MMMYNIVERLSKLTTINEDNLMRLNNVVSCCVSDAIHECVLAGEDEIVIDFGFCKLLVAVSDNSVKYKFIPNAKLEEDIVNVIKNNKNALDSIIVDKLKSNLISTYKDLF